MRTDKLIFPLMLVTAAILVGCGGGTNSTTPTTTSISGKVIDGYIKGATVCLDINLNNVCDAGEPSTTTDSSGGYTLPYSSDVVIANIPIVVNVPVGAIDQSDGTVTKPYTLAAPSGNALVISPFTTLSLYKIKFTPNMTYGQAAQAVADSLMAQGASFDPSQDFIAAGNTAIQNAARATVALLQSSNLNTAPTQAKLDAFMTAAQTATQYGYNHPSATLKQIQQQVATALQSTLTVSSFPITGTTYTALPAGLASDQSGNIFAIDGVRVLKIDQTTGAASEFVSGLTAPAALATDINGNLYIADQHSIFKVTPSGTQTTLAGSSTSGFVDGTGTTARFYSPHGISATPDGTLLYVADTSNNAIRKIDLATGIVATLDLSSYNTTYATYLMPDSPKAITATNAGVYFAGDHSINRWDGTRITSYLFSGPTTIFELTSTPAGDVYYTDALRAKVYKFIDNPILCNGCSPYLPVQIAGTNTTGSTDGPATTATFNVGVTGITVGGNGTIYVSDSGNRKIRTIK